MSSTKEQTVYVKNISSEKSEKEVRDFFSFCGKIQSIEVTPADGTQNATVIFEKETAAKTALLLDNTALGNTQVKVTSATGSTEDDGSHFTSNAERDSDEITQEQKPRSRIVAEYLAHGYVIGDQALQKAIDLDKKHGVTDRFYTTLQNLDKKYHGTDKAKSIDQSYGVTQKVTTTTNSLLSGLSSYYEKATQTGPGKKFADFYSQSSRQVQDIHSEARRLADLKKEESGTTKVPGSEEKTKCKCGSVSENCPCAPGQCACTDCKKSDVKKVEGGKTQCSCGGDTKKCGCAPGECACSSCPKATMEVLPGGKTKCGACGGDSKKCLCETGKCACDNGCAKANVTEVAGGKTTCTQCKGDSGNCPCEAGKCACDGCGKASV